MALLTVEDLRVEFVHRGEPPVRAVDGVSFTVEPGQTVGLVGESGCGKSVTSLAVMGLLPKRETRVSGRVTFDGVDLLDLPEGRMRRLRGRDIGMIFQDPLSALNPVVPIGVQVAEVLRRHQGQGRTESMRTAATLLDEVGIAQPERRLREYPHQISGGMRQRALIAMALACRPRLLIADEPTTALDVTIQAQILALLRHMVERTGTALVLITHDLGVVAGMCDVVDVLYAGAIVERASRYELFDEPRHPYTAGLLASVPRLVGPRGDSLRPVPGSVDETIAWASGCAFAPRCGRVVDACTSRTPILDGVGDSAGDGAGVDHGAGLDGSGAVHAVRCHNPVPEPAGSDGAGSGGAGSDGAGSDGAGSDGAGSDGAGSGPRVSAGDA